MSIPMIQIDWLDGRITRYPECSAGDSFGQNIQAEVEIKLDDLSDGIWILIRHNEPEKPQSGVHTEEDPRGLPCKVYADCFYQIATAEDMSNIAVLRYEGEPRLINDNGELLNLSKFNALRNIYLGEDAGAVIDQAAQLYKLLEERGNGTEEQIAALMGLPVPFLEEARRIALLAELDEEERDFADAASTDTPLQAERDIEDIEEGEEEPESDFNPESGINEQDLLNTAWDSNDSLDEEDYDFS